MLQRTSQGKSPWSPYDRPALPRLDERRLSKVAVMDVGSSSVRLVVFDGAARSPAYFYNEKLICNLGSGLSKTGILNPSGKKRALEAIKRFKQISVSMGIKHITAVATAAVRTAKDGLEFCYQVHRETGQKIWVIDGIEEAKLAAQGVLLGWPGSYGLVCDIGGASMELAEIQFDQVGKRVSSDLGPLQLLDLKGGRSVRRKYIRKTIKRLAVEMGPQQNRLFLVGGSWRILAKIDMYRVNYPLHVLHEYRISKNSVAETLEHVNKKGLKAIQEDYGISPLRLSLLPFAGEVLEILLDIFEPKDIAISSYGLREGLLYQQMSDSIRSRDPLIEACKISEKKDSRVPGMGKDLFNFVFPLFRDAKKELLRVVNAACLLHDVSWRAHPDYRAQVCFDYATRANLGGLKHSERIFLGLALMHRYTNRRNEQNFAPLLDLLDEDGVKMAEVLGKAMRLGAMLWVAKSINKARLFWEPNESKLTLTLSSSSSTILGEVVAERLQSLSDTLSAKCYFASS